MRDVRHELLIRELQARQYLRGYHSFRTNQTSQLHLLNFTMKLQDAYNLAAALSVASAHTIMQSFNGNPMGDAIYMPSTNMVYHYNFL